MEKIVTINGKEYKFVANAAMSYIYRRDFGKDMVKLFQSIINGPSDDLRDGLIDDMAEVAFVMARLGGQEHTKEITEWLMQFSYEELLSIITPAAIQLWKEDSITTSVSKNA